MHQIRMALCALACMILPLPMQGAAAAQDHTAAPSAWPTLPSAGYRPGVFQAGIVVLLYNTDYDSPEDLDQKLGALFVRLIDDHVNALAIAWPVYMAGVNGNTVARGEKTPSDDALIEVVHQAKLRGFKVILHPIIDENSIAADGKGDWRGTIRPADASRWFASYGALLAEYAGIAQTAGADALAIGTELNSMEKYSAKWRTLASLVRKRFAGELTYSSNQGVSPDMPWNTLDFVSIDAFFELETRSVMHASVADMIASWQKWIPGIEHRAKQIGKPIIFSEIGVASQQGSHAKSWLWSHGSPVDLAEQARFYAAACAVWKKRLSGIYWWDTTIWFLPDPTHDGSFMPLGKPAEQEMKKCYE